MGKNGVGPPTPQMWLKYLVFAILTETVSLIPFDWLIKIFVIKSPTPFCNNHFSSVELVGEASELRNNARAMMTSILGQDVRTA